jgi:glycosyltransferase involved in cell wall biosynthesis
MSLNLLDDHGGARHIDLTGGEPRVEWRRAVAEPGGRPSEAARPVADLDLIIPVLNEEHRLPATLEQIGPHLRERPWTSRLIIVDNGSVDATAEVVDQARALDLDVEMIGCRTRGKGAAVRAGIAHSTAAWVGYCDADLSTPLETIDEAVHQLQRGFEVVIASRRCTGARYVIDQPVARRLASRAFHALTGTLVGSVSDTQCGLKFFAGPTARALFAECEISGFTFDVEVLGRAHRAGLRMIELPVDWSHADGSSLQIGRESMRVAREVLAVHRTLRTVGVDR